MNSTRIPSTIRFCRSKSSNSKENIFNFSLLLHIIKGKGVIIMAQTVNVNFKLDRDVKMDMEQAFLRRMIINSLRKLLPHGKIMRS